MTNTRSICSTQSIHSASIAGRRVWAARGLVSGLAGAVLALGGCALEADAVDINDELALAGDFHTEAVSTVWAYAWAHQASGTYVADPLYSRNSSGNVFGEGVNNTVTQLGTGEYRVRFPGIGTAPGGNVQVTAYGTASQRCKVQSWSNSGGNVDANVRCFDASGAATNAQFSIAYVRNSGTGSAQSAYVWANQPGTASYIPNLTYQFNSSGAQNTIERVQQGVYDVTLPDKTALGATVEVTAYGTSSDHCKVDNWSQSGSDAVVRVRCFDTTGAPADEQFTLVFARSTQPNGGLSYSYAWANNSGAAMYTPHLWYQEGYIAGDLGDVATDITAGRTSEGLYFVELPGMSSSGSNVQITAYGSGSEYCKVQNWHPNQTDTQVNVACYDAGGSLTDTSFVLVYTDDKFIVL